MRENLARFSNITKALIVKPQLTIFSDSILKMEQPTNEKSEEAVAQLYVLSPLVNFASNLEEIQLGDNLAIALPTNEEKRIVEEDFSSSALSHLRVLHEWQFVIRSVIRLRNEGRTVHHR